MTKSRLPPIGFWSYVRRDDELARGRVGELRDLILAELESQLGQEVPVFKDTVSIAPGARWAQQTTHALNEATFFIPVLTPSYLLSEWCCREVRLFVEREKQLRAAYPELPAVSRIFPIHYIDVTDADARDEEVREILMALQHLNFQGMRHRACDDPVVQIDVAAFVKAICNILRLRVEVADGPLPGVETTRPPTKRTRKARQPRRPESVDHGLDVILAGYGPSKIIMTKEVQAIAGVTVRDAMAIVDGLPWPIARGVSIDRAMQIMARIEGHGGTVELHARSTPAKEDPSPPAPMPEVKPEPVALPSPAGGGSDGGTPPAPSNRLGKSAAIFGTIAAVVALLLIIKFANRPSTYEEGNNYYAQNVISNDMAVDANMTMDTKVTMDNAMNSSSVADTNAADSANASTGNSASAMTASPVSRQVVFSNSCNTAIDVRLVYYQDGAWQHPSGVPWHIPAHQDYDLLYDGSQIRASDNLFYFQAQTSDGAWKWEGSNSREFDGQYYPMRQVRASVNEDGDYVVSVSCPVETR